MTPTYPHAPVVTVAGEALTPMQAWACFRELIERGGSVPSGRSPEQLLRETDALIVKLGPATLVPMYIEGLTATCEGCDATEERIAEVLEMSRVALEYRAWWLRNKLPGVLRRRAKKAGSN